MPFETAFSMDTSSIKFGPGVTREVGASAVVSEHGAGIVVEGEPASLAQGIQRLLNDRAGRAQMGRNGRNAAASRYSWDAVAARMGAQYAEIVSRHPL